VDSKVGAMEGAWGGAGHRRPWERTRGDAAMGELGSGPTVEGGSSGRRGHGGAPGGADRRGRELRSTRPWGKLRAAPTVKGGSSGRRGHGGARGGADEGEGATAEAGEGRTQGAVGDEGPGRG